MNLELFAKRLKNLICESGMQQKDLAEACNVTPSTISRYVNAEREPGMDFIKAVSEKFGVSKDFLLGETDIRHPDLIKEGVLDVLRKKGLVQPNGEIRKEDFEIIQDILDKALDIYLIQKKVQNNQNKKYR